MKILSISNYQMQNQNKKQDVNFGVNLSNRAIKRIQQCMANGSVELSHETAECVGILQKLDDSLIEGIDFFDKGGLLLRWKDTGLASTVEMPQAQYIEDKVPAFLQKLLSNGDTSRMSKYMEKVAGRYFPVEIAEMRLKFPACKGRDNMYGERVLAKLESLKAGKKPIEADTLAKWREGIENDAYGSSNDLV